MASIESDKRTCTQQMAIIEKYERVIAYLYPIAQSTPRKHGVARDRFLDCMFAQIDTFIVAGKSGQVSKLYLADANLAALRFWIRFHRNTVGHITQHQEEHALALIAEVGSMLGGWIGRKRQQG